MTNKIQKNQTFPPHFSSVEWPLCYSSWWACLGHLERDRYARCGRLYSVQLYCLHIICHVDVIIHAYYGNAHMLFFYFTDDRLGHWKWQDNGNGMHNYRLQLEHFGWSTLQCSFFYCINILTVIIIFQSKLSWQGPNLIIAQSNEILESMSEWCTEHHGKVCYYCYVVLSQQ